MRKKLAAIMIFACVSGLMLGDAVISNAFFGAKGLERLSKRQKAAEQALEKDQSPADVRSDSQQTTTVTTTTTTTTTPASGAQDRPVTATESVPVPQNKSQSAASEAMPTNYFVPVPVTTQTNPAVMQAPAADAQTPVQAQSQPAVVQKSSEQLPLAVKPQAAAVKKPPAKAGDVSFNFDDADVFSVIQTIFGDVMKVNYIMDPNVKGRVNFRSVSPVAREDVFPLMEVILRLNGIAVVEESGLYRIIPIGDISKEPAPVEIGRDPEKVKLTGQSRVQVVPVLYSQSSELTRVLTPFLSKNALIIDIPKSNYIIIVDTDANIKRLLQLVDVFDNVQLKQVTPKVFVYPVQNSKAKDVSSILQQIFLGARPPQPSAATAPRTPAQPAPGQPPQPQGGPQQQPQVVAGGQAGTGALISEGTRIIADEITNSIIILASPEDYMLIYDTLLKIDVVPRQVMIEGLIVQVKLKDNLSFGVSWSMEAGLNLTDWQGFKNSVNIKGPINISSPSTAAANLPAKGFTFVGKDPSGTVRAVLSALAEESKAKVLASPHLLVSDNREARMQVGSQVPLTTSQTSTTAATGTVPSITSTVQYKDIGIILKVKPQVNDSGLIFLELAQEISSIGDITVDVGGLKNITIDKIEATSNLVAKDGETIIIGGLIREDSTKGKDSVPLLSKIPLIGNLFGNTTDDSTRTELIILLTPHVMRNLKEAGDLTKDYLDRYRGYSKDKGIDDFMKDRSIRSGNQPEDDKKAPQ
ncbi:MAG: hypothetical protein HZB33_08250 [Nitrospirae bacterium]|nr:hypothetical protein [Nitrospirota bacterium]